jgi:glycosyltransferase involved in cell wall biosynthesis
MIAGQAVLIVAPSPPPYGGMAIQARLLEKFLTGDGHPVIFVPANPPFPAWIQFIGHFYGLRTAARTIVIWLSFLRTFPQAKVIHILAASRVYFFTIVCPAMLLGRLMEKRVILNYRGGDARKFFGWAGWMVRPFFKLPHMITAPSGFLAGVIQEFFGCDVRIVPNILDSSLFHHRRRTTIAPKLLVTRHLEKAYDVETAIRAFRAVQQRYPEASLWIAGTGSEAARLRSLVEEWKLANVRFLGYVAHQDLGALYDQCDILLNSSRVDNFPGSLLEAAGAGLVVVSTGAGGIPFMFENGKNALLVEPGDWEGLARSVQSVLESAPLALSLASEASALALRWDWQAVRKVIYETYGFDFGTKAASRAEA